MCPATPNGRMNGSIETEASFWRMYLNEPITVRLLVTLNAPVRSEGNDVVQPTKTSPVWRVS